MEQFIRDSKNAYNKATGLMPNDEIVSKYALAYQISCLVDLLEDYLSEEEEPALSEEENANNGQQ